MGHLTRRAPISLHVTAEPADALVLEALELAGAITPSRAKSMAASATTTADRFSVPSMLTALMELTPSNFVGPIPFHLLVRRSTVPQTDT